MSDISSHSAIPPQTSADAHATYLTTPRFGSLDGLRFICIMAVLWHHLPIWQSMNIPFLTRGHTGVDFFFVVSGFLITALLLREETKTGKIALKAFYWRRILRIIPIYFFVVTVAATYSIGIKGETQNLEILPYYYLFLTNFIAGTDIGFLEPTWSLSVEEQYYLIWPLLLMLSPRRWIIPITLALITLNVMIALGVFDLIGITAIDAGPLSFGIRGPTYAPILLGALMAIMLNTARGFTLLAKLTHFKLAPWVWMITLGLALHTLPEILRGWPNLVVHLLMCLALTSIVIREDNGMARLLQLRPIARIGQISYGIYLYHLFALAVVSKAFSLTGAMNWWWVLVIYTLLSILISEISFRTLEAWFMKYRHKFWGNVPSG